MRPPNPNPWTLKDLTGIRTLGLRVWGGDIGVHWLSQPLLAKKQELLLIFWTHLSSQLRVRQDQFDRVYLFAVWAENEMWTGFTPPWRIAPDSHKDSDCVLVIITDKLLILIQQSSKKKLNRKHTKIDLWHNCSPDTFLFSDYTFRSDIVANTADNVIRVIMSIAGFISMSVNVYLAPPSLCFCAVFMMTAAAQCWSYRCGLNVFSSIFVFVLFFSQQFLVGMQVISESYLQSASDMCKVLYMWSS